MLDACIANICSHFVLWFSMLKHLLMKSNYLYFLLLVFSAFCLRNFCLSRWSYCLILSSISVIVSPITMRLMMYLKPVFVYGVGKGVRFIDLALYIEKTVLLPLHFMGKFCAYIRSVYVDGSVFGALILFLYDLWSIVSSPSHLELWFCRSRYLVT